MVRHVCGISGGKDSSALAVYMRDKVPEMEYFFCDTGAELPETYTYLKKLEAVLGKPIARLNSQRALPFCTKLLKIKPLEEFGDDGIICSYTCRHRKGHISSKPNIAFIDDNLEHDILRILTNLGLVCQINEYTFWVLFLFFSKKIRVGRSSRQASRFGNVAIEQKVMNDANHHSKIRQ